VQAGPRAAAASTSCPDPRSQETGVTDGANCTPKCPFFRESTAGGLGLTVRPTCHFARSSNAVSDPVSARRVAYIMADNGGSQQMILNLRLGRTCVSSRDHGHDNRCSKQTCHGESPIDSCASC
jgi:hypothetical protein